MNYSDPDTTASRVRKKRGAIATVVFQVSEAAQKLTRGEVQRSSWAQQGQVPRLDLGLQEPWRADLRVSPGPLPTSRREEISREEELCAVHGWHAALFVERRSFIKVIRRDSK